MANAPVRQSVELHQFLVYHFNLDELQELCFILGVRYDDLNGQTLSTKAAALQSYLIRRNRLAQLITQLTLLRPKVDWSAFTPADSQAEPPFKGLRFFSESDADLFYGREALTAELISHLTDHRFLAVVGSSGSGKSSLVRAGVIPAVRRGEIKTNGQTSAGWPIHVITPGDEPLKELAASLTHHSESVMSMKSLLTDLQSDAQSLDLWLYRQFIDQPDVRLLLIVDQFEELFTQCSDSLQRSLFIENLTNAVQSGKQGRLSLILTLRADFYAHAVQYESLRPLLETGQKIVGPLSAIELRQAIEGPAKTKDWHYQPGLVDLILRDLGSTESQSPASGVLPLLSHALLETWRRREGRMMTLAGYQEAGGVHQAIAATADEVYAGMTPKQQSIARHLFLQLTELGQGTEDSRRRVQLEELAPQAEDTADNTAVLNRLVDHRLVTVNGDSAEVAHEALIRSWPLLRDWLDEDRARLRIHRQLTAAAQAWQELNQDPGALYRGLRLVQAEAWLQDSGHRFSEVEKHFITASRAALIAEEHSQAQARKRARRTPVYSFVGGALGFSFSFLWMTSPMVGNQGLLLALTVLRLVAGGLAGLFLVYIVDFLAISNNRRRWLPWVWGGVMGSGIFALLIYVDTLLRVTAANAQLSIAAVTGMVWGLPAGLGRVWMLKSRHSRWRIMSLTTVMCGFALMLTSMVNPALADAPLLAAFLSGAIVPFAILVSAHLADH